MAAIDPYERSARADLYDVFATTEPVQAERAAGQRAAEAPHSLHIERFRTTEHEADDVLDLAEAAIIAEPELRRLKLLDAAVEAQAAIVRLVEVALVCIEHRHCARRVCGGADIELAGELRE